MKAGDFDGGRFLPDVMTTATEEDSGKKRLQLLIQDTCGLVMAYRYGLYQEYV
jgi:hypothetical protein